MNWGYWVTWPTLDAQVATIQYGTGGAPLQPSKSQPSIAATTTDFERMELVLHNLQPRYAVRANGDGAAQTWSRWDLSGTGTVSAEALPGRVVTWAPMRPRNQTDDAFGPTYFGVSPEGIVTRYTPLGAQMSPPLPTKRDLTVLPAGYAAAYSSAKMVHTNGLQGSLIFPGFKNGAPRLFRVHIGSGELDEWAETEADTADQSFGWSALDASDGVVCYANAKDTVRCGCLDTAFKPVN